MVHVSERYVFTLVRGSTFVVSDKMQYLAPSKNQKPSGRRTPHQNILTSVH